MDYHHASCWSPTQYGWVKEITKNFFTSWTGLSSDLVLKYLNKTQATILGHIQHPRKYLRSTQKSNSKKTRTRTRIRTRSISPIRAVSKHQYRLPRHIGFDREILHWSNRKVPITSRKFNKYILVAYYYDSNTIHAEPLKRKHDLNWKLCIIDSKISFPAEV